ncbi:hypothetical protein [Roseovarius sp.]|uniref:hypothetical protein n=1 Tax=Roseovarius sp. TaxID=1486281 RepID=UPI00257CA5C0|nr:hypothetical protein [Roseovarius sp.]
MTLDWNCIVELEQKQAQAPFILQLVEAHRSKQIEVALLAASASENARSKLFPGNAEVFKQKIAHVGLADLPLVPMPAIAGLSYWDFAYYVGDEENYEEQFGKLWEIIAPKVGREIADHLPEGHPIDDEAIQSERLAKWRNAWCDVMSAYCHIRYKRDCFVTNNTKDFQRNEPQLLRLGMQRILNPKEACREFVSRTR